MYRGTAKYQYIDREPVAPIVLRPTYPFLSAAALVRWHLGPGRQAVAQLRALDPSHEATSGACNRDWLNEHLDQFSRTSLCLKDLERDEERLLLEAFGEKRRSDDAIAERRGVSRRTICRLRNQALRKVRDRGRQLGLLPPEDAAGAPLPASSRDGWHRPPDPKDEGE
jgi:hypothetical protein